MLIIYIEWITHISTMAIYTYWPEFSTRKLMAVRWG